MKLMTRTSSGFLAAAGLSMCLLLAGCGDDSGASPPRDASVPDGGSCGNLGSPGILQLKNLVPPPGARVPNQSIVHSFTVVNAPARFTNFELQYGGSHSAYLPRPARPTYQVTENGMDVSYQFVIESWAFAPAHVEIVVPDGFQTAKGCRWQFPSPLFSYDITATAIDGGLNITTDSSIVDAPAAPEIDGRPAQDSSLDEQAAESPSSFDAAGF